MDQSEGAGNVRSKLTKAQIGRLGELLFQIKLLEFGIDSAPLTTDSGVDLVAYTPRGAVSFQVKCNLKPKPGGGKSAMAVDWYVDDACPADILAFVRYDTGDVWLVSRTAIADVAQQHANGRYHFYMYVESRKKDAGRIHSEGFAAFHIDNCAMSLLGAQRLVDPDADLSAV